MIQSSFKGKKVLIDTRKFCYPIVTVTVICRRMVAKNMVKRFNRIDPCSCRRNVLIDA